MTSGEWIRFLNIDYSPDRHRNTGGLSYKIEGDLLYLGGVAPIGGDGKLAYTGKLGAELTAEEGYKAARLSGFYALRLMKDALGSLDKVDYVVKSLVLVSGAPGFDKIYDVADGFSDILTEALGERGLHARNAVGANVLNGNAPVICDAIIKIKE